MGIFYELNNYVYSVLPINLSDCKKKRNPVSYTSTNTYGCRLRHTSLPTCDHRVSLILNTFHATFQVLTLVFVIIAVSWEVTPSKLVEYSPVFRSKLGSHLRCMNKQRSWRLYVPAKGQWISSLQPTIIIFTNRSMEIHFQNLIVFLWFRNSSSLIETKFYEHATLSCRGQIVSPNNLKTFVPTALLFRLCRFSQCNF